MQDENANINNTILTCIPCILKFSEKIKNLDRKVNIRNVLGIKNNSKPILKENLQTIQKIKKKCIYKIPRECCTFYIGQNSIP